MLPPAIITNQPLGKSEAAIFNPRIIHFIRYTSLSATNATFGKTKNVIHQTYSNEIPQYVLSLNKVLLYCFYLFGLGQSCSSHAPNLIAAYDSTQERRLDSAKLFIWIWHYLTNGHLGAT